MTKCGQKYNFGSISFKCARGALLGMKFGNQKDLLELWLTFLKFETEKTKNQGHKMTKYGTKYTRSSI